MIINFLLNVVVLILSVLFGWLPEINVLPTIVDINIDQMLVTGVGQLKQFMTSFWAIAIMMQGFLFLVGYYSLKMVLKFIIGHRAPD